jgi:lysophospholipase L1-like esterase
MPRQRLLVVPLVAFAAACADSPVAPSRVAVGSPSLQQSEGRGVFQRYVAIGTSISMGVQSDGAFFGTQTSSWPAQLARMGDREITQPYIQFPGCHSPIAPPLGLGVRLSGEQTLANPATLSCAPLVAGITPPTQNVAIFGARASDALSTTPQNVVDPANGPLYSRVMAAGQTQVSAMEAQNPKLVSVELGANEVLDARSGVALVGPPPFPIENPGTFAARYDQILDRIDAVGAKQVLLVGLPTNPFVIPGFRSGAEIAANATTLFVAFNVAVDADCGTTATQNLMYVPLKLAPVMQAGLQARLANLPAVPFSCAASPNPTTVDLVLTPAEQAIVATVVAQMNAAIQGEAQARGLAFFSLDAFFAAPGVRTPLDVVALFTTAQPFGLFMSLDGLHPNAAGQAIIAQAAAQALNATYNLGIPTP